jgi:LmbE family N-acetylglucosaminyl deacetylase
MVSYFDLSPCYERKITHTDYDYIFLSPHFDDVVFSCSGTIGALQNQGCSLLLATIFAGEPLAPFSLLAQSFHRFWNTSAEAPYRGRQEEERKAMALLKTDYVWLDWLEILYRAPHLTGQKIISGADIPPEQDSIFPSLCQWLAGLARCFSSAKLVIPLGIGGHSDHLITRQAACDTYDSRRLIFYEDFPYAAWQPHQEEQLVNIGDLRPCSMDITPFLSLRVQATLQYPSQIRLFYRPPERIEEVIRSYTARQGEQDQETFVECCWAEAPGWSW